MDPAQPLPLRASATGRFGKTPFAHLLVYAHERSLTGTFDVTPPGDAGSTVVVREGRVVKVRTGSPVAYLGGVLYERGAIDAATLNATLLDVATKKRLHGETLIERGAITRAELDRALREQIARKLHSLFLLPSATDYSFYDGRDALADYGGADGPLLDPLPLVWQGLRANPPIDHVAATVVRIADGTCVLLPGSNLARFDLSEDELRTAECLRTKAMGVTEFLAVPMLKPNACRLLLHFLVITKQVKVSKAAQPVTRDSYQRLSATGLATPRPPGPISFTMRAVSEGRPFTIAPPRHSDARANFEAAEIAFAQKDYAGAEKLCERAHKADPDSALILAFLAWIGAQRPENKGEDATREKILILCLCEPRSSRL